MLDYKRLYRSLDDIGRLQLLKGSAVRENGNFGNFFKKINTPKTIVEIGTYRGITAAVLASMADKVYTFDAVYQPATQIVWQLFNVSKKIDYRIVGIYKKDIPLIEVTKAIRNEINIFTIINDMINQVETDKQIAKELENIKFDFAYIDARHYYDSAKRDFKLVKKCGRVMFDDCGPTYPGMQKFIKEINGKFIGEFGYWEAR